MRSLFIGELVNSHSRNVETRVRTRSRSTKISVTSITHSKTEPIMIKRYNNISLALGVPGIIIQIVGNFVLQANQETPLGALGGLVLLVGTALLISGLAYYAMAKGRSGWWGLCGFLSFIGLIILACLKDLVPEDNQGK